MRHDHALFASFAVLAVSAPCQAAALSQALDPTLDLMIASPADGDLSSTPVGQAIVLDVVLSGLDTGGTLELLAATIEYDQTLWGIAEVARGPIVPDTQGFITPDVPVAGMIDGVFDPLPTPSGSDQITSNGVFFSFELTALAEGTGAFAMTFSDALGENGLGQPIDGVSPGIAQLPFEITIPEPSGLVVTAVATFGLSRRRPA